MVMKAPRFRLVTCVLSLILLGCGAETLVTTGIVAENSKNQVQALKGVTQQAGRQIGLSQVKQAVTVFQAEQGRFPSTLDELVTYGYMYHLPQLAEGQQFVYDNRTGQVRVGRAQYPRQPGAPRQPGPQTRQGPPGYGGSPYMQQFNIQQEFQYGNQAHYGGAASAQTGAKRQFRRINRNYQQRQNRYLRELGY
jgi:hypothetical protein